MTHVDMFGNDADLFIAVFSIQKEKKINPVHNVIRQKVGK